MKRLTTILLVLCAIAFGAPGSALCQITGGAVTGTIFNQAGEPLASVKVTATNSGTNQVRSTVSGPDGRYRLTSLSPGQYEITVEADDYTKVTRLLIMQVNEDSRADFQLSVAGAAETLNVLSSSGPITETSNSALGLVIANKQIVDLPLNGRNFLQLGTLVANVSSTASLKGGAEGGLLNGPFAVAGQRDRAVTFLVDGVDSSDSVSDNLSAQVSIDAIQEFKMITNLGSGEYGYHSGGVLNIITRTGTNDFHASAFEFFRNRSLNAANFFDTQANLPAAAFHNNQFGVTAGGPVIKNKTFFLMNYEGQRLVSGVVQFSQVPTLGERQGIFTDPATNQVVHLAVDPVSAAILARFVPLPNVSSSFGNFISSPNLNLRSDSGMARIDQIIGGSDVVFARYLVSNNNTLEPVIFNVFESPLTPPTVPGFGLSESARTHNLAVGWTHSFKGQTVNDFRFGYNRHFDFLDPQTIVNPADLGFHTAASKVPIYEITIPGITRLGTVDEYPVHVTEGNYHISDSVAFLHGRQSIKVGGEIRLIRQFESASVASQGSLFFFGTASNISPLADFILGEQNNNIGGQFRRSLAAPMRQASPGFFIQDDFQASHRLTINLGLRYELNTVLSSPTNQLTNYSFERGFWTPGVDGAPSLYNGDHNNFAPRLGFAWSVTGDGRTVLRGGYGIYYDTIVHTDAYLRTFRPNDPLEVSSIAPSVPGGLANVFAPANLSSDLALSTVTLNTYDRNLRTPYAQHFNLNLQRELGQTVVVSIGYVGTKSSKVLRVRDINQAVYIPGTNSQGRPISNQFNADDRRPTQLLHLTPFPVGSIFQEETSASSIYHSLQATFSKRFSHGLTLLASYTWSKSIDDATDPVGFAGDTGYAQDSNNLRQERGLSTFDMRHRFTAGYTYALPFHGSRWRDGWQINGITTLQSGQPFTVRLGTFGSVSGSRYIRPNFVPGAFIQKGGQVSINPDLAIDPQTGIPLVLEPQGQGFGTLGRNVFTGPGYKNMDLSIFKDTPVGEKLRLQARLEIFNVFNTTNLALPDASLVDPTFGISRRTQDVAGGVPGVGGGGPRVIQLALKFVY